MAMFVFRIVRACIGYCLRTTLLKFCWLMADFYYYFCKNQFNYWTKRGVRHIKPKFRYGNMEPFWKRRQAVTELLQDIYHKFPNERYVGFYQFNLPQLMLRDPELIRDTLVNNFQHFPEHRMFASQSADPIWSKNIFVMKEGPEWKKLRTIVIEGFTRNKLEELFSIIKTRAETFNAFLLEQDDSEMNMLEIFGRVTNDIIATAVFGYDADSISNPFNEFFQSCSKVVDFSDKRETFYLASVDPRLPNLFNIRFMSKETETFFKKILLENIEDREDGWSTQKDMLQLLVEAKSGYDTTSRAMALTAYELATNPRVQRKLRKEIEEILRQTDGQVDYTILNSMKYLDMVISESLRKWPPFAVVDRKVVKPFEVVPQHLGEKSFMLNGDVACIVPVFAMHRDPKFYPVPEKFYPERFENTNLKSSSAYMPFGIGRRNCVGNRFALLEIKAVIFYIISEFKLKKCNRTQIPLVLSLDNVNPVPEQGIWLKLVPRER